MTEIRSGTALRYAVGRYTGDIDGVAFEALAPHAKDSRVRTRQRFVHALQVSPRDPGQFVDLLERGVELVELPPDIEQVLPQVEDDVSASCSIAPALALEIFAS
ncbi:MAG TPA: hypothetical protein VHN14_22445 [Kofleriaceae bacterium]|nr:hypothetical protein [Kofleriaceae bacterium]